jgi:hypothetical protein
VAGNSFWEVIEYLIEGCTNKEFDRHAEVARRIWFRRNLVVHGGEFNHPNQVIISTTKFIKRL